MVTFSDLLMLILTFFVMLLSMSRLDASEIEDVLGMGLSEEDRGRYRGEVGDATPVIFAIQEMMVSNLAGQPARVLENLMEATRTFSELEGNMWSQRRPEGIVISIDGEVAFEHGGHRLTPQARQFLNEAIGLVGSLDANLLVEVYVDGGGTVQDSDAAWELSLRRADRVARFATGMGLGGPNLRIMGYGERAAPEGSEPERSELLRLTILSGDSDSHRFL